ncbi:MAG: glycosyltransferase [Marinomonas sp.]
MVNKKTLFAEANEAFLKKEFSLAQDLYFRAKKQNPSISALVDINLEILSEVFVVDTSNKKIADVHDSIKGALNSIRKKSLTIDGWLANYNDQKTPRTAFLKFDNGMEYEVEASGFRGDLNKVGLSYGKHGFSIKIPAVLFDGKKHSVELFDKATRKKISKVNFEVDIEENFSDFDGMLRYNFLNPVISSPFDENKKRCLAFCDVFAKKMEKKALFSKNIKVSVLMAVFDRAEIVGRAIKSILSQSYDNFELIIIDDGSADRTVEVIESFNDDRVIILKQKVNKGKSAAINLGLDASSGDWIAYLDSDNTWDKKYLAAMIGSIQSKGDIDAIYSGQYLYSGNVETPYAARLCPFNKNLLLNRNYIDHNSFMHTKEVYKRIGGYDENLRRTLDYDYILNVMSNGVIASTPLLLTNYYYDVTDNSITSNAKLHKDIIKVEKKAQDMLRDSSWSENVSYPFDLYKEKVNPITVVIPSYESLSDIDKCISSVLDVKEIDVVDIIVVDNNSSFEVVQHLKELEKKSKIKLILNKENYGFTYAVNQAIELSNERSDIVLLNNDAQVTNGALALLSRFSNYLPDAGLLVPSQILFPKTKTMDIHVPYINVNKYGDVNISIHHNNLSNMDVLSDGSFYEIDFAPFFCVYIPRNTLNELGPLDAELGRHYRSDRLYCNSVRKILNKKIYYIPDSRVFHGLQKSTDTLKKGESVEFDVMFKKNKWQDKFMEKFKYERRVWDV